MSCVATTRARSENLTRTFQIGLSLPLGVPSQFVTEPVLDALRNSRAELPQQPSGRLGNPLANKIGNDPADPHLSSSIHDTDERARTAAVLLVSGAAASDVVGTLGYYDEPHLARALRRYVGRTAQQLREGLGGAIALDPAQRTTS
ncbi:hypothetical protein [Nocardia brevicatena]|uniref:hypothetical protein n=1 Tax=Nocardia brevicatena TaxID=37327 RepID=UPI000593BD44|nr:hypothetical protein [Nocardia brevicatena]